MPQAKSINNQKYCIECQASGGSCYVQKETKRVACKCSKEKTNTPVKIESIVRESFWSLDNKVIDKPCQLKIIETECDSDRITVCFRPLEPSSFFDVYSANFEHSDFSIMKNSQDLSHKVIRNLISEPVTIQMRMNHLYLCVMADQKNFTKLGLSHTVKVNNIHSWNGHIKLESVSSKWNVEMAITCQVQKAVPRENEVIAQNKSESRILLLDPRTKKPLAELATEQHFLIAAATSWKAESMPIKQCFALSCKSDIRAPSIYDG
ncbi:hypothetical protein Ciccas_002206 [Cichlidogyrus casuarinus]|uniref:Uncharacterized protein n=1 Tax=Cichlidogyrus casuarinus TaxID=1844966 RepID=A0ABD2QHV0_9PLAT